MRLTRSTFELPADPLRAAPQVVDRRAPGMGSTGKPPTRPRRSPRPLWPAPAGHRRPAAAFRPPLRALIEPHEAAGPRRLRIPLRPVQLEVQPPRGPTSSGAPPSCPPDGLQRRAARCLLSLPSPPWPAHRRLVSPLSAQSPLEPFLGSATNPRADLDPAGGLRSRTGTPHDPSVAADRCAGAERACRRARLAPNTSSIECVSRQTRPFRTVSRFAKGAQKGLTCWPWTP